MIAGGPAEDHGAKLKEEEEEQKRANLAKLKKALARKQGLLNGVTKRRANKKKEEARRSGAKAQKSVFGGAKIEALGQISRLAGANDDNGDSVRKSTGGAPTLKGLG